MTTTVEHIAHYALTFEAEHDGATRRTYRRELTEVARNVDGVTSVATAFEGDALILAVVFTAFPAAGPARAAAIANALGADGEPLTLSWTAPR